MLKIFKKIWFGIKDAYPFLFSVKNIKIPAFVPPQHFNCRCVTIPVLPGEHIGIGDTVYVDSDGFAKSAAKND